MLFLLAIADTSFRDQLGALYIRYKRDLFLTAYDILKDFHAAEDAVQSVMIRLSFHLDKITEVESKKTRVYLVVTMRNYCFDQLRKQKKEGFQEAFDETCYQIDDVVSISDYVNVLEDREEIDQLLQEIRPDYADLIMLRYYHEYSVPEIASILEITENNAGVRIHRAVNAVRKKLIERRKENACIEEE